MKKRYNPAPSATDAAAEAPASHRRRGANAWLLFSPAVLMLGFYIYWYYAGKAELAEALAEVDRLEPGGWRLEDLEANRSVPPDEQNSALQIIATEKLFPAKWAPVEYPGHSAFWGLAPEIQLTAKQTEELSKDLRTGQGARVVAAARKLADMPDGRFPIRWSEDWVSTDLRDVQLAQAVVRVLGFDATLSAQEGDADGACHSCRAIVNLGRAMRDEPSLALLMGRVRCFTTACAKVERVLAQGQPSVAVLADLQHRFEQEASDLSLLPALRGERAGSDRLCLAIQGGKVPLVKPGLFSAGSPPDTAGFLLGLSTGSMDRNRAAAIRYMTEGVQIAQLPLEQHVAAFKALDATYPKQSYFVRNLMFALGRTAQLHSQCHALLRCATVILAAERFRRQNGRWPETIGELVPTWLAQVPTDPFDGQPLRYRRLADGVVVYSIGEDGVDSGGMFDRTNWVTTGSDQGFRLWGVEHRRQLPPPAATVSPSKQ